MLSALNTKWAPECIRSNLGAFRHSTQRFKKKNGVKVNLNSCKRIPRFVEDLSIMQDLITFFFPYFVHISLLPL